MGEDNTKVDEAVASPETISEPEDVVEVGMLAPEDGYIGPAEFKTAGPDTTWQQRLYIEHWGLTEKLVLLGEFMKTSQYMELHPDDRTDLSRQFAAMSAYREILSHRLSKI